MSYILNRVSPCIPTSYTVQGSFSMMSLNVDWDRTRRSGEEPKIELQDELEKGKHHDIDLLSMPNDTSRRCKVI